MARDKKQDTQPDLFSTLEPPTASIIKAATVQDSSDEQFAEIAVVGPVHGTFTYRIPPSISNRLVPGARVLVPFGGRTAPGFFVTGKSSGEVTASGVQLSRIKPLIRLLEPADSTGALLTPDLIALARWMSEYYVSPLGTTLQSMLPAGVRKGSFAARIRVVFPIAPPEEMRSLAETLASKKPAQAALLMTIADAPGPLSAVELLQQAQASDSALKALEKAKLIEIREQRPDSENDPELAGAHGRSDLPLNSEQRIAFEKIEAALNATASPLSDNARPRAFLLQGVTGSGKTEVYLRALKIALAQGRQAIVLVPEIALTPQTAQRFEQRLGRERIAILHSHVTDGERAEAWRAVRAGQIDVVIGARSALFAPLPRLGIIVIDEEHEGAFKQESTPRYHSRDVAMERARLASAVLILGSATPSFEALHAARIGALTHLSLTQRVEGRPMPPVEIIDLNKENKESQRYVYLSGALLRALGNVLSRGEQAILFMNRRGFATVLTCQRCGFTEKCEYCDITLTSHQESVSSVNRAPFSDSGEFQNAEAPAGAGRLHCHYCGFSREMPDVCGGCGMPGIKHWGLGTERVEKEVRKMFPSARIARMDSDTMVRRTAYLEALGGFASKKIDILVGTQMIAKGLDYPNVTLVGVVLADTGLHMPDFRSRERTFQLLAQVAGRAGRGPKGGRVIVQTHMPDDPAIRAAARHDFDTFSLQELKERKTFAYPPFTRLARILLRGKDQHQVEAAASAAAEILREHTNGKLETGSGCVVLGPAEAPISKLEGQFRHHIMLKAANPAALTRILSGPAANALARLKGASITIDVDPLAML